MALLVSGWNAPSNLGSVHVLERTGRKPQQMWSAQAKKKKKERKKKENSIWCCSHTRQSALMSSFSLRWSTMATSTLQDQLTTLSGWPCYPGGFKLESSIKNNKLSSLHLTELLLASSLNQMERILSQSQSAASLPNFKQLNSSFLLENSGISFPTQWDVSCPASVSLRSSLFIYGSPGHFTVKQLKSCHCRPTQRAKRFSSFDCPSQCLWWPLFTIYYCR